MVGSNEFFLLDILKPGHREMIYIDVSAIDRHVYPGLGSQIWYLSKGFVPGRLRPVRVLAVLFPGKLKFMVSSKNVFSSRHKVLMDKKKAGHDGN